MRGPAGFPPAGCPACCVGLVRCSSAVVPAASTFHPPGRRRRSGCFPQSLSHSDRTPLPLLIRTPGCTPEPVWSCIFKVSLAPWLDHKLLGNKNFLIFFPPLPQYLSQCKLQGPAHNEVHFELKCPKQQQVVRMTAGCFLCLVQLQVVPTRLKVPVLTTQPDFSLFSSPQCPSMPSQHFFPSLKIGRGNRGHGVPLRACYVQGVLPFVLSPQRHSHEDPEGLPLCGGLPDSPRHQWGLHCRGQQHRHALPVLPAPQPDEEVQLRGESAVLCTPCLSPGWCLLVCESQRGTVYCRLTSIWP